MPVLLYYQRASFASSYAEEIFRRSRREVLQ